MAVPVDYSSACLTRGLIAYIGNKRSLLPFLGSAFARCADRLDGRGPIRFLDPFAGSGGVSRLARAMGFDVRSNDREYYAALIGRCRVALTPDRLEGVFAAWGGCAAAFRAFDAFAKGTLPDAAGTLLADAEPSIRARAEGAFAAAAAAEPYIALHYAPRSTESADWRSERLFYTAENARFLDRAREAVELLFPGDPLDPAMPAPDANAKAALLDALLYEAATRVNTSGVFKACHRGFGGHGKDALGRIVSPMRLRPPELCPGLPGRSSAADAAAFCAAERGADIAYLDPPYNQHQYGSNYHLLTTIARWDKPSVPEDRDETGFLLDRAGIRRDWTETRSDFCRRGRAAPAFSALLDSIDARFILVSYSDGGIIPLEELRGLLAERGELSLESVPYVAYRGGKQSATRMERTSELLFVIDAASGSAGRKSNRPDKETGAETLRRIRALAALEALKRGRFDGRRLSAGDRSIGSVADGKLALDDGAVAAASTPRLESLAASLRAAACGTKTEAFDVVFGLLGDALESGRDRRETERLARDALAHLRKIAFRKYAAAYAQRSRSLKGAFDRLGSERLRAALATLDERAAKRLAPI